MWDNDLLKKTWDVFSKEILTPFRWQKGFSEDYGIRDGRSAAPITTIRRRSSRRQWRRCMSNKTSSYAAFLPRRFSFCRLQVGCGFSDGVGRVCSAPWIPPSPRSCRGSCSGSQVRISCGISGRSQRTIAWRDRRGLGRGKCYPEKGPAAQRGQRFRGDFAQERYVISSQIIAFLRLNPLDLRLFILFFSIFSRVFIIIIFT